MRNTDQDYFLVIKGCIKIHKCFPMAHYIKYMQNDPNIRYSCVQTKRSPLLEISSFKSNRLKLNLGVYLPLPEEYIIHSPQARGTKEL